MDIAYTKGMKLVWTCGLVLLAATSPPLDGNQILARAGAAQGLNTFSVPVHFDAHMRRPIGIRYGADAIVYFRAPARATLTITSIPGIIGKFFKGSYAIDWPPQVWPAKYTVNAVSEGATGAAGTFVLVAVPKTDSTVDHVIFTIAQGDYAPLSADWFYKDGSIVRVAMECDTTPDYSLVKRESIGVSMPRFSLDANAVYGSYALNVALPDGAFR
jgi:hypothetical protein